MNTNDLKIFESVAAHASFTKAAEEMFTVQSNVTARIKSLEEELKTKLFRRTSRQVVLTEDGEKFLAYSRKINSLAEESKQVLNDSGRISGTLKIGAIETTMALHMPGLIFTFTEKYPEVTLSFLAGNSANLISDVLNYKLDAAFVVVPNVNQQLGTKLIRKASVSVITSNRYTTLNDLGTHPLKIVVFDHGCSYRQVLETWLNQRGISNYQCVVLNTLEGIIDFVEAGVGITVLPDGLVTKLYHNRQLNRYPIEGELGIINTALVYRNDATPSKALQVFMDLFDTDTIEDLRSQRLR